MGEVVAIDEDIDENGLIDYAITDGNEKNLFVIEKGNKSKTARIRTLNRIDHEQLSEVLLTIKCYKATDIIDLSTLAKDYSLEVCPLKSFLISIMLVSISTRFFLLFFFFFCKKCKR